MYMEIIYKEFIKNGGNRMTQEKYIKMLSQKSVIREISAFGEKRAKEIGAENVFDFSLGNPSVLAPKLFDDAIKNILNTQDTTKIHGYGPSAGIESVQMSVASSLNKRFDMQYSYKHIFMTSGAASAIAHAIRAVCAPSDEVLIFAPYFPEYIPYIHETGAVAKIVPPDIQAFQIQFDVFEEMLTTQVSAVLINSPNNPSGVIYSDETLRKLSEILQKKEREYGHPIFLISDEPYREIVFEDVNSPYVSHYYRNTIQCYSFSKSLSIPGERIGYIAVNPACVNAEELVDVFGQISRGTGHNGPSTLIQLAVEKTIDMTANLTVYETNKNLLFSALTAYGYNCVEPEGTFYMFPKSLEENANYFCEKAKEFDLLLVPGDSFGCEGHFRIAYCIETEKVKRSLPIFEKLAQYYLK